MGKAKGLILCGGEGRRLRPITYYFQKTMIPVGLKQKPVLEYAVRLLRFHGIQDIILLVNYKAKQIKNYFEDGSRFDVRISYVYDDPSLKGTAGSVINAHRQGLVEAIDTLVVYYGDVLTNMNLKDMLRYHTDKRASATVALASGFTVRVGLADLGEDGRISGFVEKPEVEKPVSIGIIVFKGETLGNMELLRKERRELDLMGDVVSQFIKAGKPVYGYISDAFWYDVLSIEAYEKLSPKLVDEKFKEIV